jgi:hypothetical protein
VVDETTQNAGKEAADEAVWGERNFFDARNPSVQVMSARADHHYPGVAMERTMFLIADARLERPVALDLFRLVSDTEHTYDYPIHFRGPLISTDVKYKADTARQEALGKAFGYQHIWREASGTAQGPVRMTWLDGNRYYSVTTAFLGTSDVIFSRIGANDPNFNLISEPMMIVRTHAGNQLYASVIEPHGYFSEPEERSTQARPLLESVRILADSPDGSVIEVTGPRSLKWTVMVANGPASTTARHRVVGSGATWEWTGNYRVEGVETALKATEP